MSISERYQMRKVFFESWKKHAQKLPLTALETQVVNVILLHPEYHLMLNQPEIYQDKDYTDSNPFLHLSLHLGIREQLSTNRPQGIREVHQLLCQQFHDVHTAEHQMMDCLAKILWETQKTGIAADDRDYLKCLQGMVIHDSQTIGR